MEKRAPQQKKGVDSKKAHPHKMTIFLIFYRERGVTRESGVRGEVGKGEGGCGFDRILQIRNTGTLVKHIISTSRPTRVYHTNMSVITHDLCSE